MPAVIIERLKGNSRSIGHEQHLREMWPIVAIDPGVNGAVAISDAICSVRMFDLQDWSVSLDALMKTTSPKKLSAPVILLEDQFVGRGAAASIEVTWLSGAYFGYLLGGLNGFVTLVQVAPITWQTAQRKRMGVKSRLKREEGIRLAVDELPEKFRVGNKLQIEGRASAMGILRWWKESNRLT